MKFSIYYRIQQRDIFFEKFIKRFIKKFDESMQETVESKYNELLEIIVQMILNENMQDLELLLTKSNAKIARIFFDYLTCSNIRNKKKTEISNRLNELFIKETIMKDFKEFLSEKISNLDMSDLDLDSKIILTEEDDPFGDDAGGDEGGDEGGDPFGGDDGDGDGEGEKDEEGGEEEKTDDTEETDEPGEINYDDWEDDPDWTQGVLDPNDLTQTSTPAGESIYDVDGIMKSIQAVIQGSSEVELAEIEKVKTAVELIFNGKLLKVEDVTFENPTNASYLIKKIGNNVDEKTKNYMLLKIKTPLLKQRDMNKLKAAAMKKDTNDIRNTISELDK